MTLYSLRGSVIVESLYLHKRVLEAAYNCCLLGVAVENLVKFATCLIHTKKVLYLAGARNSKLPAS